MGGNADERGRAIVVEEKCAWQSVFGSENFSGTLPESAQAYRASTTILHFTDQFVLLNFN